VKRDETVAKQRENAQPTGKVPIARHFAEIAAWHP